MIISRLRMVLTNDELDRITVKERESGKIRITADVHGMKCYEARRFINNIIYCPNSLPACHNPRIQSRNRHKGDAGTELQQRSYL